MVLFVEKQSFTCYEAESVLCVDHGKDWFSQHLKSTARYIILIVHKNMVLKLKENLRMHSSTQISHARKF